MKRPAHYLVFQKQQWKYYEEDNYIITFVLTIEESDSSLETKGTVVGLKSSHREEELMNGMLKAIEKFCVKERMPVSGGEFVRTDWPIKNETTNNKRKGKIK